MRGVICAGELGIDGHRHRPDGSGGSGSRSVTITDPATGFAKTAQSGATGLYDFNGLNPANYNMKVTAKGFEAYRRTASW